MKKLATILCLSALATAVYAQGTVNFLNSPTTLIRTNSQGIAGGGVGPTAPSAGGFYYALFTASSTVTTGGLLDLLTPTWTFTGLHAVNTVATTGGRFTGGGNVATLQGWAPGATNSYMIAGWSARMGTNWAAIIPQLAGGEYIGGVWNLRNAPMSSDGAWIGASPVAFGAAGGGASGLPAFSLFGTVATAQGTPLTAGYDLFIVQVPEPTSFALAGLGAAALLIFRRRK